MPFPSPPRCCGGLTFDAGRGVTVAYGGGQGSTTDEYDGTVWVRRGVTDPTSTEWFTMTYDAHRGYSLLFDGNASGTLRQTWAWDGRAWTLLDNAGATRRRFAAAAYVASRGVHVPFGGQTDFNINLSDTWEHGLYPDCDVSTGIGSLDVFDFLCFLNRFNAGDRSACDCDASTVPGACDIFDFLCFLDAFMACR